MSAAHLFEWVELFAFRIPRLYSGVDNMSRLLQMSSDKKDAPAPAAQDTKQGAVWVRFGSRLLAVDLCIVTDATASMGAFLNAVRAT
jgi:hypothetical protein